MTKKEGLDTQSGLYKHGKDVIEKRAGGTDSAVLEDHVKPETIARARIKGWGDTRQTHSGEAQCIPKE